MTVGPSPRAQGCGSNPVVCENNLTGNPATEWDIVGAGDASLQGFATDISVNKGGTVHFKISTTASSFQVNIYRLGYYGGMGARKVATLPTVTGRNQPACLTNNTTFLVDCGNWSESTSWAVPTTAVSGIYFAKLTRSDTGGSSHVTFIVRDDASTSDILLQTSDTTWQAYNQYGGFSLYLGTPQAAFKVSYNRPFATRGQTGGYGPTDFVFYAEYPMVRWLESNGYDVSYFTGVDSDRNGALIRNHKAFLSVGHDEYWSGQQRANVEAARGAGVSLGFFSGNEVFWKTRFESSIDGSNTSYRTLVTYKETHANAVIDPADPPTWTGTWRDPRFSPPADARPENSMTGQFFTVNRGSAAITVPAVFAGLRFWRNTSVAQLGTGGVATLAPQSLGYEWDQDADNGARPPGVVQLSSTTVTVPEFFVDFGNTVGPATVTHNLTMYRHASGAIVFGAGTVQWVWGLDVHHDIGPDPGGTSPDLNMQQATMNLFGDMGIQPQTRQPPLFPAIASTDVTPPTSAITVPANGASLASGAAVTITGTAADSGGGVVGGVEVSVDGGSSWRRASGTQNWSFVWTPGVLGATSIKSRAVDDSGNLEQPLTAKSVTITPATCPCNIWGGSVVPWNLDENDASSIEVGVKFRSDVTGQITGLRFYKSAANTGSHTGHLWSSSGTLLGSLTFAGETASGWQQSNFTTPVTITAGTTYVASYHTNVGHYAVDSFYFGRSGKDQWPLHGLATGVDGPNGVFVYGASAFPSQTYQGENYWVDVVLGPVDTTPPTVTMTAPANGATVSGTTVSVSATASDNIGVAGVQFKLDGGNLGAEVTTSPYTITWNSTLASNATHTLTAVARDAAANTKTATAVTVTVFNPDTTPPTVSMTAPAAGAAVAGTNVTVSATASDANGVVGLQFLLDGASLGTELTTPPYTIGWNTTGIANGAHNLSARARDAAGNQATSTAVGVTVANGAPLMDVNVFTDKSNTNTTIVSPTFSTTATNELLLAFVGADDNGGNTVTGVTGGGLTWQLVRRTNVQFAPSEIWRAFAPAVLSNVSVTATLAQGVAASLTVVSFSNVDTSGSNGSGAIGATGTGNANPGAPTATLTTTRAGSWVFGVGSDWEASTTRTPGANQTLVHKYTATGFVTVWVQRTTNPVSASGTSVTINDTAPTADRYNLTICEVLAPSTPTWSISGTISPAASGTGSTVTLSGAGTGTATADASGNFSFSGLANGTYTLTPSKTGFTFTPASKQVIVSGANVTAVNFTAAPIPTWSISGTISPAATGNGSTLTLSGAGSGTTTADSSGNFTFSGRANGTYTVTPSKSGFTFTPASQQVTVNGANVTAVNFTVQPIPTWSISGTISAAADGNGSTLTLSGAGSGTTTADASGNFSFSGLANGNYTVTPSKTGFTFSPTSQPVTVNGANVTAINFTATALPILSISGTISPAATGNGSTLTLSGAGSGTATADASGNFSFLNLGNGTYTVTPSKSGFTFTPASQQVTVSGANVTGVTFAVQPIPTWSISGTISPAATGTGSTVTLSGAGSGSTTADSSGNFSFSGLANGTYTVTPSKTGFTFTPANQQVIVNGANVTAVNFTVQPIPTWSISGTISPAATGTGSTVTLSGAGSGTTTADASGNFSFSGLANGLYTVTPSKAGMTFTPANQQVTVNGANVTAINFTIQAGPSGLTLDTIVSKDQSSSSMTIVTPTFATTSGSELLLAFITADYLTGAPTTVIGVTGAGLTWQLVARTNFVAGTSEIWRTFASAALSNVAVTATLSQPGASSITVVSVIGADPSGANGSGAIGATFSASGNPAAPSATVVTTRNNSWVFGVGNDYDTATARTLGPNQTMVHQYLAAVGDTYWVQRTTATTPVSGTSVTINDTAPTGDQFNLTLCEILPAGTP